MYEEGGDVASGRALYRVAGTLLGCVFLLVSCVDATKNAEECTAQLPSLGASCPVGFVPKLRSEATGTCDAKGEYKSGGSDQIAGTCQSEGACDFACIATGQVCPCGIESISRDKIQCRTDCPSDCGNGKCDADETTASCPGDCTPPDMDGGGSGAPGDSGAAGASTGGVSGSSGAGGVSTGGSPGSGGGSSPGPSKATNLSAGVLQACALTTTGNVECWIGASSAKPVPTITDVVMVSSGGGLEGDNFQTAFSCAVTMAGAAWCWGDNRSGNLGNGSTTASSVPVPVKTLGSGVTMVSAGSNASACAVTSDGSVWCWGNNGEGELGNGSSDPSSLVPVELDGFPTSVTAVSVGYNSACALDSKGGVECWGTNNAGQLGDGSATKSLSPVQVAGLTSGATAVSVGNNYACAVVNGGAQCWGNNGFGASGAPEVVTGLASGVTAISVGDNTACAVVSGAVECWGGNGSGQLGNGSKTDSAVPVPVTTLTKGASGVAVGFGGTTGNGGSLVYACAVTSGGGVWCWGSNNDGSPGPTPVRISGFTG